MSNTWENRSLKEILIGGSNEAGMFSVYSKSGLGIFLDDKMYITQSLDLYGQACAGSRWFDIKVSKQTGEWRLYSTLGSMFMSFSIDIYTAMFQLTTFLEEESHSHEILFWKVSVNSGDTGELANILRGTLAPYMVDNHGNITLPTAKLSDIWGKSTYGHVIVMANNWSPPAVQPGKQQGWIWDLSEIQVGDISDAHTLNGMLTKCQVGQFPRLVSYKNSTSHFLMGIWWVYSSGLIQENTANNNNSCPNALNDFFTVNKGEIGNVLISDFFGDYPLFMKIIWDYNFNKYVHSPPLPPAYNYAMLSNPALPGIILLTDKEACDNSGKDVAKESWESRTLGLFSFVIVILFIALCILPVAIYHHWIKAQIEQFYKLD